MRCDTAFNIVVACWCIELDGVGASVRPIPQHMVALRSARMTRLSQSGVGL